MKRFFTILGGITVLVLSVFSTAFAYTNEEIEAYQWAYKYSITTQPTVEAANLNGNITRQAFAKMVINYLENAVGVKQSSSNFCYFPDEDKITSDLRPYTKKTCSYSIMGSNGSAFNPINNLSKAQLGTVLSRIIRGDTHNSNGKLYYIYHVNALQDAGIMDDISNVIDNPAKRGDVLVMFKRMYDKFGSNIYLNGGNPTSNYSANKSKLDVVDYNDSLVEIYNECDDALEDFGMVYDNNPSADSITKALRNAVNVCEKAKEKAIEIGSYEGDDTLKNAVVMTIDADINFLNVYETLSNISDKDEKHQEAITILEKKSRVVEKAIEYLGKIQEAFAEKHGLELDERDLSTDENNSVSYQDNLKENTEGNVVYTGKDETEYTYNTGFINLLIKTANKKGESDLVNFLKVELDYFEYGLEMANFDEEEFAKELGIDLDNLDKENMTKKEKEELAEKFGVWVENLIVKNKDRNDKFLKDLGALVKNIKNDKFGLKEKYEKTEAYIEIVNPFLDTYGEIITNLVKASITMEEGDNEDELIGQAFGLIGLSLTLKSSVEEYQSYLDNWGINTINLLGGELVE